MFQFFKCLALISICLFELISVFIALIDERFNALNINDNQSRKIIKLLELWEINRLKSLLMMFLFYTSYRSIFVEQKAVIN